MPTRDHVHEEVLPASPEVVFELLHTPSAICSWWGASRAIVLPGEGGLWAAAWGASEDDPDYITAATIERFDPPAHMRLTDLRYRARSGPLPFEADFTMDYYVDAHADGSTLKVVQSGFPAGEAADDYYQACVEGWRETFRGIRRYLGDGT